MLGSNINPETIKEWVDKWVIRRKSFSEIARESGEEPWKVKREIMKYCDNSFILPDNKKDKFYKGW